MLTLAFKNADQFRKYSGAALHKRLVDVLEWFIQRYGYAVITSSVRSDGIHSTYPLRAVDLRSSIYPQPDMVADEINRVWTYDPSRPQYQVCVYHDVGMGMHFHIQVHKNTMRVT